MIVLYNEIFDSIFLTIQTEQVVFMYVATTDEKRGQELEKEWGGDMGGLGGRERREKW